MVFEKICLCFFLYIGLYAVRGMTLTDDGYLEHGLKGGEKFPRAYVGNRRNVFPDWITDLIFTKKCLEGLGCFDTGPPFYHPLLRPISLTPFALKNMKTKFYLYTSKHQRTILEPNDKSFSQAPYNKSLGLQIFIHGFQMQFTPEILAATEEVIGAIMNASGQNLILVDWSASNKDLYPQAVANGRVVGAQVAQLIKYLQKAAGLDPRKIHLIGHSLGSHVSGWAAERTKNLGRITGLDPAGPYFQFGPPEIRLDPTDAEFVDVIHTNAAEVAIEGLGIEQPIGHIDFYVNDGTMQHGCEGVLNTTIAGIKVDIMLPIKVQTAMHFLGSIVCAMVLVVFIQPAFSGHPALAFIGQAFQGSADMLRAYTDMRQANWKGADKYFHARGNFDAANRGPGGRLAAQAISNARETIQGVSGRGAADSRADQVANQWGRNGGNPNFFRPAGLPSKY